MSGRPLATSRQWDRGVNRDSSRRPIGTGRASLVSPRRALQELHDACPAQLDGGEHHSPRYDSARTLRRGDDVSPVFIECMPPRETPWLAGFPVETQTMLSVALPAVRTSLL